MPLGRCACTLPELRSTLDLCAGLLSWVDGAGSGRHRRSGPGSTSKAASSGSRLPAPTCCAVVPGHQVTDSIL